MTKINKLNQTFVPQTEATAQSQNLQSAKIDEVIDAITTSNGTVAFPVTKGDVEYKVTTLGSNLSVSGNTLNSTSYTLPVATSSSLGGVKVGDGLTIAASGANIGKLSVDHDSTLTIDSNGKLSVTNPGGGDIITSASNPVKIENKVIGLKYDSTLGVDSNGNLKVANPAKISSVSNPLSLSSGTLGVKVDDSTIKVNSSGQLYSTVSGGVTTQAMNDAISNAIGALDVDSIGGSGKYIQSISETNGKITASAATLPTTSVSTSNHVHTLKYSSTTLMTINDGTQTLTIGGDSYFLLKLGSDIYYQFNTEAKTKLSGSVLTVSSTNKAGSLTLYVPIGKVLLVTDGLGTPVTSFFIEQGIVLNNGALYVKYTYTTSGTYINQTYTITATNES